MPDMTPVANQVNPPDPTKGINTFAGILGLKQRQQQLQLGQQQLQVGQAEVQGAQQQIQARSFMQNMMQTGKDEKGESILGADGDPDPDKTISAINRNVPTHLAQPIVQNILKTQNDKVNLADAVRGFSQNAKNDMSGIVRSMPLTASSHDISAAIDNYVDSNPKAAAAGHWVKSLISDHWDNLAPDKRADAQLHLAQQLQPAASTAAQQQPSITGVQTTKGVQPFQQNPLAIGGVGPAGGALPNTAPPSIVTAPNKQLMIMGGPSGGGGGGGAPSNPNAPAQPAQSFGRHGNTILTAANDPNRPKPNDPGAAQDAWSASVTKAQKDVTDARESDSQYGNNMAVASQIRRLSNETHPGPGTSEFIHTVGAITSRFGGSQGVTNMQTLESFLDRQAALMRSGMSLPATNAGEEQARTIGGNIGMQGGAIQAKNNYNESLAQGLHDYRTGLDHVEHFSGNASPSAVNAFKSAWASNFDPVAYEWKLAMQRGDKQTASAIAANLSASQRAQMQQRGRNLDLLSQGKMPQQ